MARADSYNRYHLMKILREHDRTAKSYKNYVDPSRSYLNFGYGNCNQTADENYLSILARCNDIMNGRPMQKQTNVISEWIITYPARLCREEIYNTGKVYTKGRHKGKALYRKYNKPVDDHHCKKFFDIVYSFVEERYGGDNLIAGYVHMDETTPQIHVIFVPESISRKNGKRTVSSASCLTRSELRNFHRDLAKEMVSVFGKDANDYILNGRTQGGYTTDELKKRRRDRKALKSKEQELSQREETVKQKEQAWHTLSEKFGTDNCDDAVHSFYRYIAELQRREDDNKLSGIKNLAHINRIETQRYQDALELDAPAPNTIRQTQRSL